MTTLSETLKRALVSDSPLSLREIARRSGVSRTTISHWLNDDAQPTIAVLREVLSTVGLDIQWEIRQLSDADAASVARYLLGEDIPLGKEGEKVWLDRFSRWNLDEEGILHQAAVASNPFSRQDALFFLPTSKLTVAAAADSLGQRWAYSAENLVWCEDAQPVAQLLPSRIRQTNAPVVGGVNLVSARGTELLHSTRTSEGLWRVSELQEQIDLLAWKLNMQGGRQNEKGYRPNLLG